MTSELDAPTDPPVAGFSLEALQTLSLRDKVNIIETMMLQAIASEEPGIESRGCPTTHHFSPGVYAREMFIRKGTLVTGKIHKYQQLNVLLVGDLSVLTEEGVVRVRPPFLVVSPPGTKRIAYAHEDSIWLTVLGTNETDIDKIEARFTALTEQEYEAFLEQAQVKEIA